VARLHRRERVEHLEHHAVVGSAAERTLLAGTAYHRMMLEVLDALAAVQARH